MKWVLLIFFAISSSLIFIAIFQAMLLSDKRLDKRIKHYLDLQDQRKLNRKKFNLLVQLQLYKQKIRQSVLTKKESEKLTNTLSRAGIPLKPEEYIMFQWI